MNATTSVRTAAKKKLTELLAERLGDVQVTYGHPGGDMEDESVWTDDIPTGTVEPKLMKAGRQVRNDTFTLTVFFRKTTAGGEALEQEQRVEELYGALAHVLADKPTLDGLPGIVHCVQNGEATGPASFVGDEGRVSFMTASVEVKSFLQ